MSTTFNFSPLSSGKPNRALLGYRNEITREADAECLNDLAEFCHGQSFNAGWYNDPKTGEPIQRNTGEMLCLIHSEISEAMEGVRKNLKDDHLPQHPSVAVELADAMIRIFDLAGYLKLDLGAAFVDKIDYNARRADHRPENRAQAGGKAF